MKSINILKYTFFLIIILFITNNCQLSAQDNIKYCNSVQNKVGLIRYPLGTIAATSNNSGEIADAMTLVPIVYPCLDEVVKKKENDDWRSSISGDPSILKIEYRNDKPSGESKMRITVTPHISVFNITFPTTNKRKYIVFDFSKYKVDQWAELDKWTNRTVTKIDNRTIQASIGKQGEKGAFFTIKFNKPFVSSGIIDSLGVIRNNVSQINGSKLGMFTQFEDTDITFTVTQSFIDFKQNDKFLKNEFIDFGNALLKCETEWKNILNKVSVKGNDNDMRMAYTALYTMLVNIINGDENSPYKEYYNRPLSIASSAYWQFIGGFQSCLWDNYRTAYPFLMIAYPEIMKDVVNTYLARYKRDGYIDGNICLFTGPTREHRNLRFNPVLITEALKSNMNLNYADFYKAFKTNFNDNEYFPKSLNTLGYVIQPTTGGKACSETLEWSTGLHSLAMLAKAENDIEGMNKYYSLSKSYKNLWDSTNLLFRVKNADGSWGIIDNKTWTWNPNPQGLFEGTNKDWMFSVPHDPFGLINLPGQKQFVQRIIEYCTNDCWFNDYQYHYPFLLYYKDAPNEAQKIIRNDWISMFNKGIMYEGVSPKPPHNGWKSHYTSNAGWLICCMTGLYPLNSPTGQYLITSPALKETIIKNGENNIIVRALNNNENNIYIEKIKVNGKIYPSYLIPAEKLVSGMTIDLTMSDDPSCRIGNLYISSSDGFVRNVELITDSHLKCTIEAAIIDATTKIYCDSLPSKVIINGKHNNTWHFDKLNNILTIQNDDIALIEVFL
mgnify:CR=1 FL=1